MIGITMSERTNFTIRITEDQRRAIRRALNQDSKNDNISILVRGWLAEYVRNQGVEWPDEDIKWGGKR
jgi:hypothetical protein